MLPHVRESIFGSLQDSSAVSHTIRVDGDSLFKDVISFLFDILFFVCLQGGVELFLGRAAILID